MESILIEENHPFLSRRSILKLEMNQLVIKADSENDRHDSFVMKRGRTWKAEKNIQ